MYVQRGRRVFRNDASAFTSCACCPAAVASGRQRRAPCIQAGHFRPQFLSHLIVKHSQVVIDFLLRQRQAEGLALAAADSCGGRARAVVVPARQLRSGSRLGLRALARPRVAERARSSAASHRWSKHHTRYATARQGARKNERRDGGARWSQAPADSGGAHAVQRTGRRRKPGYTNTS